MTMKIEHGSKSKAAIDALKNLNSRTERGLIQAWQKIGDDLMSTSEKMIRAKDKAGRWYYDVGYSSTSKKNSGKAMVKKKHRASAPGQAPANLSGRLYKSLNYTRQGANSITFGNSAPYARDLELGSDKILPRPFLISSIIENQKNIEATILDKIKIELSKIGA